MVIMKFFFDVLAVTVLYNVAPGFGSDKASVSVKEGDSVTLHTGLKTNQQDDIKWYSSSTRIAKISGDLSFFCTDVQCNNGTERFRDRLKLDHQTGSLTIMNITNTDSRDYILEIISSKYSEKIFSVSVTDVPAAELYEMKEGGSVTLDSGVIKRPNNVMTWYFNETKITGDQSEICTDVQCKERFRDRLKLDHQTGSLTITDTRTTDSGDYKLLISSIKIIQKIFHVAVYGVSGVDTGEVSVMEGDSVTLHTDVQINQQDTMKWYLNDFRIAQIIGSQSKICTDDQCKERFRDRLKLDHQTGSLTIKDTRTTDSGHYKLKIVHSIHRRHSISIIHIKRFSITVIDSSLPLGVLAGICAAAAVVVVVLVVVTVVCVKCWCCSRGHKNNVDNDVL